MTDKLSSRESQQTSLSDAALQVRSTTGEETSAQAVTWPPSLGTYNMVRNGDRSLLLQVNALFPED